MYDRLPARWPCDLPGITKLLSIISWIRLLEERFRSKWRMTLKNDRIPEIGSVFYDNFPVKVGKLVPGPPVCVASVTAAAVVARTPTTTPTPQVLTWILVDTWPLPPRRTSRAKLYLSILLKIYNSIPWHVLIYIFSFHESCIKARKT